MTPIPSKIKALDSSSALYPCSQVGSHLHHALTLQIELPPPLPSPLPRTSFSFLSVALDPYSSSSLSVCRFGFIGLEPHPRLRLSNS